MGFVRENYIKTGFVRRTSKYIRNIQTTHSETFTPSGLIQYMDLPLIQLIAFVLLLLTLEALHLPQKSL